MKQYPLYVNGELVSSSKTITVSNPATGEAFAQVATCNRQQVRQALDYAQAGLETWQALTGKERGAFLQKVADQLERRRDEIARTITLENGKPLGQSLAELAAAVDHLCWFAEEAKRAYGRIVPHQVTGKRHLVIKSPIGVVGAITPWNFPLLLAARKVAPALAAGCPVILKPASYTPLSAVALAKCVEAAGLPKGVLQLVSGSAAEIGAELLENPICRKITFTGSTEVGRSLVQQAAMNIKPLSLELGGNAPVLVFEEADFDLAVEGAMTAKFRNTGQSCITANRIYVQRNLYERFLEAFVEKTRALKVGNGLDEGVEIGPMIDEKALETALGFIEDASSKGAKVLCGGKRADCGQGYFLEPTVLSDVPGEARCLHEEIFAPIAPICRFDSEQEGIALANATEYGLAAYVFTRDLARALRMAESLEAGTICLNDSVPATSQCPFGGLKQSGWGRELGSEGLDAFLETKHISIGAVGK